jgi:thymidylate synthase
MPMDFDVHPEHQYLRLINKIMNSGSEENGRNGHVKMVFGNMMRFSLKNGEIPLLTTKKLAYKTCFHELMWFLRGSTNNKELQEKNVHIWDGNSSREYLDKVGLDYLDEGDIGPGYGFQWCHWGAEYIDCKTDYTGKGINQIHQLIENLKDPEKRSSRRLILTAWNVEDLDKMALNPCHILCQFNVREGRYLSCSLYQRSADVGLGMPFNIASYSFLTHILAKHTGLEAEEFVYFTGNNHIYCNHLEALEEQVMRIPLPFPKIQINNTRENIEDYCLEDIKWIQPYQSHEKIKMDMTA